VVSKVLNVRVAAGGCCSRVTFLLSAASEEAAGCASGLSLPGLVFFFCGSEYFVVMRVVVGYACSRREDWCRYEFTLGR